MSYEDDDGDMACGCIAIVGLLIVAATVSLTAWRLLWP